jgi:hypothetical protein
LVLSGVIPRADATQLLPSTGSMLHTCWTALDGSGTTRQVDCSSPEAKRYAYAETATPAITCTSSYVQTGTSLFLCLAPR